ncbi:hypothetical protein K7432_000914 [Basidiobolus ranarum]|uniref:Uncharacterized protein n=1 Tax=Basidiobolus ranarum TaxID=34480 RepID=A0ABR2X3V4_9FUNG
MDTRKAIDTSGPNVPTLAHDGILLLNPTKRLTVYVTDEQNDKVGRLRTQPNIGRSLTELETLNFTGSVILDEEETEQVVNVPDGKYHIVVETLKWFNSTESDKWVSPLLERDGENYIYLEDKDIDTMLGTQAQSRLQKRKSNEYSKRQCMDYSMLSNIIFAAPNR